MRDKGGDILKAAAIIAVAVLFFGAAMCRGAMADEAGAVEALETQGFSDVTITGHAYMLVGLRGCSEKDAARFDATATNPLGKRVDVQVCAGWPFKGHTVRTP
jgi:hypothetical protein